MSGFRSNTDGDFERVFMTTTDLIDQFVGERVWAVGSNPGGVLGDGTTTNRLSPVTTAGGGVNWRQVSGGTEQYNPQCAGITTDGKLWTWGNNNFGELGNAGATRSSPGTTAGGGDNWRQVSCGYRATAAIKTDGTLWTWGYNLIGGLGDNSITSRNSPGTTIGGGTDWKQVSMGYGGCAAVKTDGTLWTWGHNGGGGLGANTAPASSRSSPGTTAGGGTTWKSVSGGANPSYAAIKTDGTLWTWGTNTYGALGDGTTTNRSSPGTTAGGGTNWRQVDNDWSVTAIKTDGTLWTWGYNGSGALGDGTIANRSSPGTTAGGGTNWKQATSGFSLAAIKTDGTLWTCGYNPAGGLGDGTTTSRSSPGSTLGNMNWISVSTTPNATFGIAN